MQDLQTLLKPTPRGWILQTAIGADGTVITGNGLDPKLVAEPWRAVLPLP